VKIALGVSFYYVEKLNCFVEQFTAAPQIFILLRLCD